MAGAGATLFTAGSILTAAQVNTYLMDQTVMRFANSGARDAAFGGLGEPVLAEGMLCYLDDQNKVFVNTDGTSGGWVEIGFDGDFAVSTKTSNYTIALNDKNSVVQMNLGGANTVTIPTNAAVPFDTGAHLIVTQLGAGQTTVSGDTGVTVYPTSSVALVGRYSAAMLIKVASDTWYVLGLASGSTISSTIIDAKGDLILGTAADSVARLAIGTNKYVLTADSAETTGAKWALPPSFNSSTTITATNASWSVPTLASPIVRVTAIGGGGAGGGPGAGGNGGTTTFNAGGAGTVTAAGGTGGRAWGTNTSVNGIAGTAGSAAANGGQPASGVAASAQGVGGSGNGGAVTVAYLNLTGITTVNVTIGAGGTASSGLDANSNPVSSGAGGRGEVIVEYMA